MNRLINASASSTNLKCGACHSAQVQLSQRDDVLSGHCHGCGSMLFRVLVASLNVLPAIDESNEEIARRLQYRQRPDRVPQEKLP